MEPAMMASGLLTSDGPDDTSALGRAIGRHATPGTVVALIGELGAGKTVLAKGVADGLGVRTVVNSPTFVLMNEHLGRLRLHHVDAYRLSDPADALAAGLLDDRLAMGVAVIEWADRLDGWLPEERLEIRLDTPAGLNPDVRTIAWRAIGEAHERLASAAFTDSGVEPA
ncbi:MAG: tRNA (adenosine(37)-N6)-threonylcarbamoyltransferase complex ATPase subunit type 1 TsaE [Chloroflexi bacterium]|nr:tRNA (adenosine(37)-N6)-threonylcarbamoyltransferase complex ATPase subunit type 1 TsaE [Chloroflexota bacterium]